MNNLINKIKGLYNQTEECEMAPVKGHEGGRNLVYICKYEDEPRYVIRISMTGDRLEQEYVAEVEFVHYLARRGASVADVIPSVNGNLVEKLEHEGKDVFVSSFEYAKGMLISANGYQYRTGSPLSEYFYNTGKILGKIHQLSKEYVPTHTRCDYFDKYNMDYISGLLSDEYSDLKLAIAKRLEYFKRLSNTKDEYGLVHFDFNDGNYHIDMSNGNITVFDFDNCMNCWYMFDLASLWSHGVGWFQYEEDKEKRKLFMQDYFNTIIEGYRSETDISDESLKELPLFIDMVLIENIVDECECCLRDEEKLDYEDIQDAAECLIYDIPFAGFC